jgi:hypothetical protein
MCEARIFAPDSDGARAAAKKRLEKKNLAAARRDFLEFLGLQRHFRLLSASTSCPSLSLFVSTMSSNVTTPGAPRPFKVEWTETIQAGCSLDTLREQWAIAYHLPGATQVLFCRILKTFSSMCRGWRCVLDECPSQSVSQ